MIHFVHQSICNVLFIIWIQEYIQIFHYFQDFFPHFSIGSNFEGTKHVVRKGS